MLVKDWMSKNPITVKATDSVIKAHMLLLDRNISRLPVRRSSRDWTDATSQYNRTNPAGLLGATIPDLRSSSTSLTVLFGVFPTLQEILGGVAVLAGVVLATLNRP